LGKWGYIETVKEIEQQVQDKKVPFFDDIVEVEEL
jgi:hypothetical protein